MSMSFVRYIQLRCCFRGNKNKVDYCRVQKVWVNWNSADSYICMYSCKEYEYLIQYKWHGSNCFFLPRVCTIQFATYNSGSNWKSDIVKWIPYLKPIFTHIIKITYTNSNSKIILLVEANNYSRNIFLVESIQD